MGRGKTQRKRAGGIRALPAVPKPVRPAISQYDGTEDRDGTVRLPKDTTERSSRVVKWLP